MSGKPITMDELAAIFMAGGRNSVERSRAKPKGAYRDPVETVKFPAEVERHKRMKRVKSKGRRK